MIYSLLHPGSGLGNMLHRFIAGKILALDKGYEYSSLGRENFKGASFMNLDFGKEPPKEWNYLVDPSGRIIVDTHFDGTEEWNEWDKHCFDPNINFVEDNTIIDGNFEDERYFGEYLSEIDEWIETEPLEIDHYTCLIGFRGGEYYTVPELGLPNEYFDRAIEEVKRLNPDRHITFEVHTDDPELARKFFPEYLIIKDISRNWRAFRYADMAIIANSSFYVLPRLLKHNKDHPGGHTTVTIAPKYFNRYNVKRWDYPQFYYKKFKYI